MTSIGSLEDVIAALAYGRIIAQCGWARGHDYDRMIAAHAISSDSILVTNNKADFRDIPGLSMENWVIYVPACCRGI